MPTVSKSQVKYAKPIAIVRSNDHKDGPLSVDDCKELIGWTEEPTDADWGSEFVLKDVYGKKIRLLNNPKNRPFKRPLADRYANEHLRRKWSLNLESMVIDKNGNVLQGQHRLTGFILAEQLRQLDSKQWGNSPLRYSALVAFGASNSPDNADTYDLGANRKLLDVLYRRQKFSRDISDKEQKAVSKVLATAIRIVWLRSGGKQVSFAPHFPHSEALEFYKSHPGILESCQTVVHLDEGEGGERCIASLVSPGYVSALHYLMSEKESSEVANNFWEQFTSGEGLTKGSPILALRQFLIKTETGGSKRDEMIGTIIKAWLLWLDEKPGTAKQIRMKRRKEGDRIILAEFPRIGGIDSEVEVPSTLTQRQRIILTALKRSKGETSYKVLQERTGLQLGQISRVIMKEDDENSLRSLGLVAVAQYEPEEGERIAPYYFKLTKQGRALI